MASKIIHFLAVIGMAIALQTRAEVSVIDSGSHMILQTEYGEYQVDEPVLLQLIRCPAMERLKHIYQYGVCRFARQEKKFTRYEHSIGCFVLLRRFGASVAEQIDGLMHDVSHTVFSHVGDFVFKHYFDRYSYQDDIHEWFLQKMGVDVILKAHGYEHACDAHTKSTHKMFEQDKPDLCIDRIEYLLSGGLVDNLITQREVMPIVDSLYFENQTWIFKDKKQARALGNLSLWLSENIFGTAWNSFIYSQAANALLHAVDIKLITMEDIHFSTDSVVWEKLQTQGDDFIKQSLEKVRNYKNYFVLSDENLFDIHYKQKFLGVNPWVETESGLQRLTEIDLEYAQEYNRILQIINRGWYIKLIN
jgi:hypothetical protein